MNTLAISPPVWLWGLTAGLLLGAILGLLLGVVLGVVFARRPPRQRAHRGRGGSVTDWALSLALVTRLRGGDQPAAQREYPAPARPNEVARSIGPRRLSLARRAGEVDPARAPGESLGTDRPPRRSAGA
jgi:hypothetical protein